MVPALPDFSAGTAFGESTIVPQGIGYSTIVVTHDANGHEVIDPSSTKTTIEVVNLLLGKGNDHVTITSTMVPGPDHPGTNSGPGIDDEHFPLPAGVDPDNTPSAHGGITTVHGGGNRALAVKGDFTVTGNHVHAARPHVVDRRRLRRRAARVDRRRRDVSRSSGIAGDTLDARAAPRPRRARSPARPSR